VLIAGPTASGKSALALQLAEKFSGTIINADSMQVYRYMDIGTAKPSAADQALVPHHLLDLVDPDEDFDAFRYGELGRVAISEVQGHGRAALVAGGTGLYVKALLHGLFPGAPKSVGVRERLRAEAAAHGTMYLYRRLSQVDPGTAQRVHCRDLVRLVRALEVWECSGRPISVWQQKHGFREEPFRILKIGLSVPRPELHSRIDERVERMMAQGFLEEVGSLLARGYRPELKSMQSLGYRHLVGHLVGRSSLGDAVTAMKRDTRRYAKRQITWFRRDPKIYWFHPNQREGMTSLLSAFLNNPDPTGEKPPGR
jgi:tRNA dimethylallyltransferase